MKFTLKSIITAMMCMSFMIMTSCDDGKKKAEAEAEAEKMEQEAAEKAEMEEEERMKKEAAENSIAAKAMETESLSTLVTAVKAADLATMLSEPGDYTVFAPNNAAFEKLPEGTVENLLKPENKEQLKGILTYHVVPKKVNATTLIDAINGNDGSYTIATANGAELTATIEGESVYLTDGSGNKSTIVATDVDASNGVVHIIDTVVMPKS